MNNAMEFLRLFKLPIDKPSKKPTPLCYIAARVYHYLVQNILWLDTSQSLKNPDHFLTNCYFEIHFNSILDPLSRTVIWYLILCAVNPHGHYHNRQMYSSGVSVYCSICPECFVNEWSTSVMAAYIRDVTQTLCRKSVIKIPHFNTRFVSEPVKVLHTGLDTRK